MANSRAARLPPPAAANPAADCSERRAEYTAAVTDLRHIGRSIHRLEGPPLLLGQGRYVDDIHLPGTLEAAFVRSPHAHAAVRGIDSRAAQAAPGVAAVLTWPISRRI